MLALIIVGACASGEPAGALPVGADPAPCPPGMVLIQGSGTTGMRGQPYGIVSTLHLAVVDAPERGCDAAIRSTPGAHTCWVQTDVVDPVLRPREVAGDAFCIDALPFPGEGVPYTTDGMTAWDAERLDELLATGRYGTRRTCTASEFELAVAGPSANLRFVYGDRADPTRCPADSPIGADPACANPETGVHEYGAVNAHWVRADAGFVARACDDPPCAASGGRTLAVGGWVVLGGTARAQTRQAPLTPHTWHDHGQPNPEGCDAMGHDDQPVICADPDPAWQDAPLPPALAQGELAWAEVVAVARQTGRLTAALETGLGRAVCPPDP